MIWTDVVQTAIYVGGTLVGLVTILHLVPGGWAAIHAAAASAGKLQVFDFSCELLDSLHVLGGSDWRDISHYGEPWDRSAHRAAVAGGARAETIGDGVAFERRVRFYFSLRCF